VETTEKNVKWLLGVSLIMFFGSYFIGLFFGFQPYLYSSNKNSWYYLQIIGQLSLLLTVGASSLHIAGFARKFTYGASVLLFALSVLLLFIEGLRGLT
jgi:hypothetical protein